jgi:membrane protein YdbS with pleckstrin-like domain
MARWTDRFIPIAVSPDERKLLLKRESLRVRGVAWLGLAGWCLALVMFSLALMLVRWGWRDDAEVAVDAVFILLLVFSLPVFLLQVSAWLDESYMLSLKRLYPRIGMFARLDRWFRRTFNQPAAAPAGGLECALVWRATVEPLGRPARWFDLGNVVVSSRTQARAVVLTHMPHPHLIAEDIMRYGLQATGAAAPSGDAWPDRSYRPSVVWLFLSTLPGQLLLWSAVMLWLGLRLTDWFAPDTLGTILTVLASLTILLVFLAGLAFLRWYYCVYLVTDRRVVGRKGVLKVNQTDLRLEEVVSATVTQSGFVRYMGVGTVQVNTAGHSGSVKMVDISEADLVRQVILDIQERLRQQRVQMEFGEIRGRLVRALRL